MASDARSVVSYGPDRLERLAGMEETHFWSQGRRRLLLKLLRPHLVAGRDVLDAGCGTGRLLGELQQLGCEAVGLDALPEAVERARARCVGVRVELGDVTRLPFESESFDCVLLLDVLEHVDDRQALSEAARVLRAGGLLAVTVPACPWLWSHRDVVAGHRRRYTRRHLVNRLEEAGFTPTHVTHYQFLLFPLFILARLLGRKGDRWSRREERVPSPCGRVLGLVNRLEASLAPAVSWPVGSSVVALAAKT